MAHSVFASSISVLFMIYVYSFIPHGLSMKVCQEDEYYQSVLRDCMPCQDICVPLKRSDCRRLCADFFNRHTTCQSHQYWEKYLQTCVNCSEICVPITRLDCKDRCGHYIDSLRTTTSSSTTTENLKHEKSIFPIEKTEENRPGRSNIHMIITVSIPIVIGIIFIAVLCWRYKAKITQLFRALLHTVRAEKTPIQETSDPAPNSGLLEDPHQNLENDRQYPV